MAIFVQPMRNGDWLYEAPLAQGLQAAQLGVSSRHWVSYPAQPVAGEPPAQRMRRLRIDVLPITQQAEAYVLQYYATAVFGDYSTVQQHNVQFSDTLQATTGLRELIHRFARQERHFFFLTFENRVTGLVTQADLNRRPVSGYLYNLLCEAELRLAAFIYQQLTEERLLAFLETERQTTVSSNRQRILTEVLEQFRHDQQSGLDTRLTEYLYFTDLLEIIQAHDLHRKLGYSSNQFEKLGSLNEMRNVVAHPVRSLVTHEDTVARLDRRLHRLEELLFSLRNVRSWLAG